MFATTALVLSAGMAAAEVKISANGRMGVTYDDSAAEKTQMNSRFSAWASPMTTRLPKRPR